MKIGVVGIGGIAQKAYLPVYSENRHQTTFLFASSNPETRQLLQANYQFQNVYGSIQEVLAEKPDGVMIHAATKVHYQLTKTCLEAGVHVFMDKPIAESFQETEELLDLAKKRGVFLMAGFNRRFVPLVANLKETADKHLLILQKNRVNEPQPVRFVVYDLLLHLVDTAVYLLEEPVLNSEGQFLVQEGLLQQVHVRLTTAKTTAFLHMDLVGGANVEHYQVTAASGQQNLSELIHLTSTSKQQRKEIRGNDWESTLHKRGFQPMIEAFLAAVATGDATNLRQANIRTSHQICEQLLQKAGY
ncbi:Gfo/Idh/MocA family protein [Enterococcus diestrammenae]|uniref:Gfo/Idh/MocA family protein n=1 Tax=Enterococcus diestrammenae TaxID=1155073 RepID=UPI001959738A